ncbi:hypothetical protein [Kallotenue papyrolyticum]|uniref:hypothetical protein n=1 Tax=Kallotenue papyrolyticum TaxID=1325125 RepID=UPI000492ACF1|nr:hypothetical protein [Kallotenue papyrolyticum]
MTQSAPHGQAPRQSPSGISPADLDALLESLQAGARPAASGASSTGEQRDLTARRVQALIRAFDVLQKQVSAIAAQGQTISQVAAAQARDAKAIADLQRSMRYLRAIVIQQLQQSSAAATPPLTVRLLLGHLVEQYQQAEQDAALLRGWAMLFLGLALASGGAVIAIAFASASAALPVLGALTGLALLVAAIFGSLARAARVRATLARRAMDESAVQRRVAAEPLDHG